MKPASITRASSPLLRTKFNRPSLPSDLVDRPRLIDELNRGLAHPLTLVSAPAGYGKTILASAWLHSCEQRPGAAPSAWLSLAETIDDLSLFLAHFVAAIQTIFPDALQRTQMLLTGISWPAIDALTASLINELDELERDFVVVLEDYHTIHKQEIHDLLTALLQPPVRRMHLVLITRRDPPLPQSVLLARHQMTEIRLHDLRFSADETADFMRNTLGSPLPDEAITLLTEKTEGWVTSLRLAALTLRRNPDADSRLAELRALERNRNVTDYLINEALAQTSPAVEDFLLKTAILDRLCGPLCAALLGQDDREEGSQTRLEWLEQNNLFTVSLDTERRWYRYHHLLRSFLRNRLEQRYSAAEIAQLHARASAWFAHHGSLEEALRHALLGRDTPAAVRLMADHRHVLMNTEQWQLLEHCLHMFPVEAVADYPDLLLTDAWLTELSRSDPLHVKATVDRAAALVSQKADELPHPIRFSGEIDALRAMAAYTAATDPDLVGALARRALANTPRPWYTVRAAAWIRLAAAHQMAGRRDLAYAALAEGAPEDIAADGAVHARVAGAHCFIAWMAGDLQAMKQAAAHMLAVSEIHHRRESLGWAYYFLSTVAYQRNDLPAAEAHARAVEEARYMVRPMAYVQSAFVHASIYQARGLPEQARQKLDSVFDFIMETRSDGFLPLAQAFQAELAAMQGDLGAAGHWATTVGAHVPLTALPYFYAPQLALPKILLAQDTPASREQAAEALARLHAFVTSIHNTPFTIEVLALEALLRRTQGNEHGAFAALEQAVALAQPGGFVRVFIDLGPNMADLLGRLASKGVARDYVEQLLDVFAAQRSSPQPQPATPPRAQAAMFEPLTRREQQILELLAQRQTAQEIAQKLVVSDQTVKRHRANIYQKLGVHSRRDAIASAAALGILSAIS